MMVGRISVVLIFLFVLGAMFSLLYLGNTLAQPIYNHTTIPTDPKISQVEALRIIESHLESRVPDLKETRLLFMWYNFSRQEYQSNQEYNAYIKGLGPYPWSFDHIRENPELLQIPLRFVHGNGTVYDIDQSAKSFEKICDEPSRICPMGLHGLSANDRLVYNLDVMWEPSTEELPRTDGYFIIDAETGEIVFNDILRVRDGKAVPDMNFVTGSYRGH